VIANFRLEHLQQVLEKLAQTDYRLVMTGYGMKVTEVLAVEGSEYIVALFLLI